MPHAISLAMTATVLLLLDRHRGQWCSLGWLAQRAGTSTDYVAEHVHALPTDAQVHTLLIGGEPYFGVGCSESSPPLA